MGTEDWGDSTATWEARNSQFVDAPQNTMLEAEAGRQALRKRMCGAMRAARHQSPPGPLAAREATE